MISAHKGEFVHHRPLRSSLREDSFKTASATPTNKVLDTGNTRFNALEQLLVEEISDQQLKLTVLVSEEEAPLDGFYGLCLVLTFTPLSTTP